MVRGHTVQAADIRSQTGKLPFRDHIISLPGFLSETIYLAVG